MERRERAGRRGSRRRIKGADAGFLYIESASQTSTCTQALVLAPGRSGAGPLSLDELRGRLAERMDRLPHLRRRLHQVPGGIGHAVWADDPHFALDHHLSGASLSAVHRAAGDADAQLDAYLADVTASRLDLARSPWHVLLLDGFADGSQALVTRSHHTMGDGAAVMTTLRELLEDAAGEEPPATPAAEFGRWRRPPALVLLLVTLVLQLVALLRVPGLVLRSRARITAVRARRAESPVRVPKMAQDAPRSVLNISADNQRALGRAVLSLSAAKQVKEAAGCTLSDVIVAVVAGAIRGDLQERGELGDEPLVVNVPLGNDSPDAPARVRGNVFVNYYALLPTDLPTARARLDAVAIHAAEAKHQLEIQGRETLTDWLDLIPPALAARAAQAIAEKSRRQEQAPDFNVLVSNLRVPRAGWRVLGREVRTLVFTGPVTDGHGLNVTTIGYGDLITCAVHSNPAAVPDPAGLASRMEDELARLVASVSQQEVA